MVEHLHHCNFDVKIHVIKYLSRVCGLLLFKTLTLNSSSMLATLSKGLTRDHIFHHGQLLNFMYFLKLLWITNKANLSKNTVFRVRKSFMQSYAKKWYCLWCFFFYYLKMFIVSYYLLSTYR